MSSSPPFGGRRILGNLDCDADFVRRAARERSEGGKRAPSDLDPRLALPTKVEKSISAMATLLRAFSGEGDRLWTPHAVDEARVPRFPWLPVPLLESGPLEKLPLASNILAWCETSAVESARRKLPQALGGECRIPAGLGPLGRSLWEAPPPAREAAATVNHRGFSLEVARSLGQALPGSRLVSSLGELDAHLAQGGAAAAPGEKWVLKAPFSSAGRDRLRGGGRALDDASRRRTERLLELHGVLLFEPWMDRVADFGSLAIVEEGELRILGVHRQEVSRSGVFRSIALPPEGAALLLDGAEEKVLGETLAEVGRRLRDAGYRGPFGVDSWRHRGVDGAFRFQPLGEINARMTFGLVARGLHERLLASGELEPKKEVRLCLGKREGLGRRFMSAIPLLFPGRDDPLAAWLEV